MRHTRLGRSGLTVSVVGLGCNNLGRTGTATRDTLGATAVVRAALDSGGREPHGEGLTEALVLRHGA